MYSYCAQPGGGCGRTHDALCLALAEELDCPLYTSDRTAFARIDTPVEIRLI